MSEYGVASSCGVNVIKYCLYKRTCISFVGGLGVCESDGESV
jgi:hypothetical protein